jgi:hypothetical protein
LVETAVRYTLLLRSPAKQAQRLRPTSLTMASTRALARCALAALALLAIQCSAQVATNATTPSPAPIACPGELWDSQSPRFARRGALSKTR